MSKNILVVSTYPEKGRTHSAKTVGGASFTKTLLNEIAKSKESFITVWAEYFAKPETYCEGQIKVVRKWQRGNLWSILSLAKDLAFTQHSTIMFSFEGYMFGSLLYSLPIFAALWIAKLRGKNVITLLHQVVTDFSSLEKNAVKKTFFSVVRDLFYGLILNANIRVVVFEQYLKSALGNPANVVVIPHAIPQVNASLTKTQARKKLQLPLTKKIALYFGYIAPYKGVDWLVKNWPETSAQLIIAGDINPNHTQNSQITQFVQEVKTTAATKNIATAGFIPEAQIAEYFTAADMLILPYQTMMSSSGPLSLAIAYGAPVIFSEALAGYFESKDMEKALNTAGLKKNELVFEFNQKSLKKTIEKTLTKPDQSKKMIQHIKKERSLENVAQQYHNIL